LDRFKFLAVDIPHLFTWDMDVVVDQVIKCLATKYAPPELLIGSDARFSLPLLRMLPAWCLDAPSTVFGLATPAVMKKKSA
jgi:hypothetical protein